MSSLSRNDNLSADGYSQFPTTSYPNNPPHFVNTVPSDIYIFTCKKTNNCIIQNKYVRDLKGFHYVTYEQIPKYFYESFMNSYEGCVFLDSNNRIMYVNFEKSKQLTRTEWVGFKLECELLFTINPDDLQWFRTQYSRKLCKRRHCTEYNQNYNNKRKRLN